MDGEALGGALERAVGELRKRLTRLVFLNAMIPCLADWRMGFIYYSKSWRGDVIELYMVE